MRRDALLWIAVLTMGILGPPQPAAAAGPWKAQVVDAETGKPLEGVVVLAVWYKMTRTLGGPSPSFYDAEEEVTGPDGRFIIASRWTFTLNPLTYIDEAEFTIFKPGYGRWRIRDWEKKPKEWEELSTAEVLAKDNIVIELPPLKTREERLRFYDSLTWSAPAERAKHLLEAVKRERAYLGLRN
jgi:hypothetical protein